MSEFNYGDPHPIGTDCIKGRNEVHVRAARHYGEMLSVAEALYERGGDGVDRALALLDNELTNLCGWQRWAAHAISDDLLHQSAAELCRAFALHGFHPADIRLHTAEHARWMEAGLAACRWLGDRRGRGRISNNLGLALAALGDTGKAVTFHEQALALARETGDRHGEGQPLGNLGVAWADLGDPRKAIDFHELDLRIARQASDSRSEGITLNNLGLA